MHARRIVIVAREVESLLHVVFGMVAAGVPLVDKFNLLQTDIIINNLASCLSPAFIKKETVAMNKTAKRQKSVSAFSSSAKWLTN